MNHGRRNHRPNEHQHQQQCLARYISNLRQPLRREFVKRLTARHGLEFVQNLREIARGS